MTDAFLDVVTRGLNYLYHKGRLGYWTDARTTAEVMLALIDAGETAQSEYLTAASEFLVSQFTRENIGGSWSAELWDTSLVLLALQHSAAATNGERLKAIEWMTSKRFPDGSFDGEPWDTLFVALAWLAMGKREELIGAGTIQWLCSLQADHGGIIAPHYTGLFVEVLSGVLRGELDRQERTRLEQVRTKAALYLSDTYSSSDLWSTVNWCNAYTIQGLAAARHKRLVEEFPHILQWFSNQQSEDGGWDDVVRTAISVRALCQLNLAYEVVTFNPLQPLDRDVYLQTIQSGLAKVIQTRVHRPTLMLNKPLVATDAVSGNLVITLTPRRKLVFSILGVVLSGAWAVVSNWPTIRSLLFR